VDDLKNEINERNIYLKVTEDHRTY